MRILICSLLAAIALPCAASATSITNMDTIPYDLQVTVAGKDQTISIEPNHKWSTPHYPVYVEIHNKRQKLEPDANYAIWKGGTLTQQGLTILERKVH